jgi:hypothetical protein
MQNHLDQLLVEPGHSDLSVGELRVRTQKSCPDRRLAVQADQYLPRALAGQGWLG